MHSALRIDELISQILRELDQKSDHLSMALTCKAFHNPSIPVLWGTLYNLLTLVKLLGMKEPATDGSCRRSENDWSRWRKYDKYVREILSFETKHVPPGLLEAAPSLETLLPSLRKVTISDFTQLWRSTYDLAIIQLISGSNLRELRYSRPVESVHFRKATSIAAHCSHLVLHATHSLTGLDIRQLQLSVHSIKIDPEEGVLEAQRLITKFIGGQRSLQFLKIFNILDPPLILLYEIAQLPRLSSLDMEIWSHRGMSTEGTRLVSFNLPGGSFPSLTNLAIVIHAELLKQLDAILIPHCTSLRKLDITYLWNPPFPLVPDSLAGLTQLETLNMKIKNNSQMTDAHQKWLAPGQQDLHTLTSLRHLRIVSLSFPSLAGPGKELLQTISQAWPKLESLTFTPERHPFPSYSPRDLACFAHHCPDLFVLYIPLFDITETTTTTSSMMTQSEPVTSLAASRTKRVVFWSEEPPPEDALSRATSDILHFWPDVTVEALAFPRPAVAAGFW